MKKLLLLLALIFATSFPIFSEEEIQEETIVEVVDEIAEEDVVVEEVITTTQLTLPDFSETYIPLEHWQKQAIYWTLKGTSLGLSTAHLISEFIFPVLNKQQGKTLYPLFQDWCHNLPSRTFQYSNGDYMPLCARCTGMNVGVFLGHFDSFIWDSFQIEGWERWEQGLLHIGTYTLLTLPLIIDGYVQRGNSIRYESTNPRRLITGILFGYAMTAMTDEVLQLILDYSGDVHPPK